MERPYFFIPSGTRFEKVFFNTILYIQELADHVKVVTQKEIVQTNLAISTLLKELPDADFCAISKHCIIALDKISSFDEYYVTLTGGGLLHADPHYSEKLKKKVTILQGEDGDLSSHFFVNGCGDITACSN